MMPLVDETPKTMAIMVTNRNRFQIKDRFDGREYVFPPDRPTQVPIDAANHIFGWFPAWTDEDGHEHEPDPVIMRRHVQRRWGWNTPQMVDKADLFFDHIDIKPIVYRMVPIDAAEPEPVAEVTPRQAPRNNKLMAAADAAEARHAGQ